MVRMLDSLGYEADTARVDKFQNYKELLHSEIVTFGKFQFYKMEKEKSWVLAWNSRFKNKGDSIDRDIFSEASSVWGYFYRKAESPGLTVDGVIEQWQFVNAETAELALRKIKLRYPWPFFNTEPYYTTDGSYLFIFHTRASAFSYRQKEFFRMFREIISRPDKVYKPVAGLE
jgi:hypothetical protein